MFGLCTKYKLEKQLMKEIKEYAGVKEFPWNDAKVFAKLISVYNKGDKALIVMAVMANLETLSQYPNLEEKWDDIMIKYKKLGLFPKWDIVIQDD